jgi:hypothetical protein
LGQKAERTYHPQTLTGKISLLINSRKLSSFFPRFVGAGDQFAVGEAASVCWGPFHGSADENDINVARGRRKNGEAIAK